MFRDIKEIEEGDALRMKQMKKVEEFFSPIDMNEQLTQFKFKRRRVVDNIHRCVDIMNSMQQNAIDNKFYSVRSQIQHLRNRLDSIQERYVKILEERNEFNFLTQVYRRYCSHLSKVLIYLHKKHENVLEKNKSRYNLLDRRFRDFRANIRWYEKYDPSRPIKDVMTDLRIGVKIEEGKHKCRVVNDALRDLDSHCLVGEKVESIMNEVLHMEEEKWLENLPSSKIIESAIDESFRKFKKLSVDNRQKLREQKFQERNLQKTVNLEDELVELEKAWVLGDEDLNEWIISHTTRYGCEYGQFICDDYNKVLLLDDGPRFIDTGVQCGGINDDGNSSINRMKNKSTQVLSEFSFLRRIQRMKGGKGLFVNNEEKKREMLTHQVERLYQLNKDLRDQMRELEEKYKNIKMEMKNVMRGEEMKHKKVLGKMKRAIRKVRKDKNHSEKKLGGVKKKEKMLDQKNRRMRLKLLEMKKVTSELIMKVNEEKREDVLNKMKGRNLNNNSALLSERDVLSNSEYMRRKKTKKKQQQIARRKQQKMSRNKNYNNNITRRRRRLRAASPNKKKRKRITRQNYRRRRIITVRKKKKKKKKKKIFGKVQKRVSRRNTCEPGEFCIDDDDDDDESDDVNCNSINTFDDIQSRRSSLPVCNGNRKFNYVPMNGNLV